MSLKDKMLKQIKNAEVYAPEYLGKNDVLITVDKIGYIQDHIEIGKKIEIETINGEGKLLVPGFIDSHVHILGGGGEGGYKTRTPEIMLSDITRAGVTMVIGCLGTDSVTRTISSLIAKARALEEEGITCYVYTGSYQIPVKTIAGSIQDDLVIIDKIISVGEIALSDHRSSQPTVDEIARIAAGVRVGGILSGKAGVVNIHIGYGDRKFEILEKIIQSTEVPVIQFIPTHVNRNPNLSESAIEYAKKGGLINITTSTITRNFSNKRNSLCGMLLKKALEKRNFS